MSDETTDVIRRLPVYLLIDCSASMVGDAITAVDMGLRQLLADLWSNPQAMDTVWLSLITFASTAEQIVPLTEISEFDPVPLSAGGATALGEAIALLSESMEREVRKTARDQKGDWKPLVFVLTDGEPTDQWEEPVDDFRKENRATVIACGAGPEVNSDTLQRLGHKVIRLQDTQPGTLGTFMQWVTMAVTNASQAVGTRADSSLRIGPVPESKGLTVVR